MYNWLKKHKIGKIISFILIIVFSINLVGCDEPNSVPPGLDGGGIENLSVGVGENINGYTVYPESTFDPMSEELYYGYLLSYRSFILVVVPGVGDGSEDNPYTVSNPDNYLFRYAQYGVYKFDEQIGDFVDKDKKLLMYYVTVQELRSWFINSHEDDNFMSNAVEFHSSDVDVAKPSRFKCENLVNYTGGLNAEDFCGTYGNDQYNGGIINNSTGLFNDSIKGGMILFFGASSIAGYITYDDIVNNTSSQLANELDNVGYYDYVNEGFDYSEMLEGGSGEYIRNQLYDIYDATTEHAKEQINNSLSDVSSLSDDLKSSIISAYTEYYLVGTKGLERLKRTYELLERSLIEDAKNDPNLRNISAYTINVIKEKYRSLSSSDEKYLALYEVCSMFSKFKESAKDEAFDIKFSFSLYSRVVDITDYSDISSTLSTGEQYTSIIGYDLKNESSRNNLLFDEAYKLSNGQSDEGDYLLLITADGFTLDRGSEDEQIFLGASDMFGSGLLQELVRMDSCPNATIAAQMYNMLAELKVAIGSALAVSGAIAVTASAIGLTIASVIGKLAAFSLATPVPGGRIVALVLAGIAGLITLGVGIYTLVDGLKDKSRIKGLGASEENYCKTYVATVKELLNTFSLPIPVYHYEIPKDENVDQGLSINYCVQGEYDSDIGKCVEYTNDGILVSETYPISIPMYFYADNDQSEKLSLPGAPMLMYFRENKLVDYIYGAATPEFIVEMLRIWGVLAFREIVYSSAIDGNRATITRTSNTTANTIEVKEYRYCFTLDYGMNLYGDDVNESYCYYNGNTFVQKSDGASDMINSGSSMVVDFSSDVLSGLKESLSQRYNNENYLGEKEQYKYLKIKDEYIEDIEDVDVSDFTCDITSPNFSDKSYGIDGEGNIYYCGVEENADGSHVNKIKNIARIKDNNRAALEAELLEQGISLFDFLEYLKGNKIFVGEEIKVSDLYFTVTFKDEPQAQNEDGKLLYYRSGTLFGWGDGYKWKEKDKVSDNSEFRPVGIDEAAGTTKEDEVVNDSYNYFSASARYGEVYIKINENGEILVDIKR